MIASDSDVRIIAAGASPASQRAVCPTKPCASVPDTPSIAGIDEDGASDDDGAESDDDGGGAATRGDGPESPEDTSTSARMTAAVNITIVPTIKAICPRPARRGGRVGAGGAGGYGA